MKLIMDWVVCGDEGRYWLIGTSERDRSILTSPITEVTGRFKCKTRNSEYLLVGPCARLDVQVLRGDNPSEPLAFLVELRRTKNECK